MTGALKILRIPIDGHFHGSADVPRPWVAQITGIDPKYGLAREFVAGLNDWRGASRAWGGNTYGVVAAFALRDGSLYEISRLRGRSSKRHVAREFVVVDSGELVDQDVESALARVDPVDGEAVIARVPDGDRVSRVAGLGSPVACAFVLRDDERTYRLRVGAVYEVLSGDQSSLAVAETGGLRRVSQRDALAIIAAGALP